MHALRKVFLTAPLLAVLFALCAVTTLAPPSAAAEPTPAVESRFATVNGVKLHYLIAAGFETFHAFEQDAKDFAAFAATPLTMPMLVLTGEKASGHGLIEQAKLVDTNVQGVVVEGSGHWLMEEAPGKTIPELLAFLNQQ
jgi:pimeloyl-ACP methyl ester carboxylesterase